MKYLLCLILCCYIPYHAVAQTSIRGKIVDKSSFAIPYCDVLLLDDSGEQTNDRTITDEDGSFTLSTEEIGKLRIQVISLGFEVFFSDYFTISKEGLTVNLNSFTLNESAVSLNAVDVTAKKITYQRKIDRTVINLEEQATTAGSSILTVLERTPGINVDKQSGSITMLGKDGVNVMINGKLSYMPAAALVDYLDGISADSAASVELITTPPAKFDAQGNAGYINIEMKEATSEGYNGSVSLSNGFGDDKTFQNGSLNFNVTTEKTNLVLNYSTVINRMPINLQLKRSLGAGDDLVVTDLQKNRDNIRETHNLRFSIDQDLTKKLNVGMTVLGYFNHYKMDFGQDVTTLTYSDAEGVYDEYLLGESNLWKSPQLTFFTTYTFNENTKLDIDYNYLKYSHLQAMDYGISFGLPVSDETLTLSSENDSPFEIKVLKTDFEGVLFSNINYSGGAKWVKSNFENSNSLFRDAVLDTDFTSTSLLNENVYAAYSQINASPSEKISFQAGLRYEYTDTNVQAATGEVFVDKEYGNFFASLYLGYKINDYNNVNLSFSNRVNRPAFTDLAPFTIFLDLDQVILGNASLQPSFTDNFQIDYRFKSISLSAQYSVETDVIGKFTPSINEETGLITLRPENLDRFTNFSGILSFPVNPLDAWAIRFSATYSLGRLVSESEDFSIDRKNSSVVLNLNNNITLKNDFSIQIIGQYNSKRFFGIYEDLPNGSLNIALQKKKGNFIYTLNGENILDTKKRRRNSYIPELNYTSNFIADFSPPQVKLSVAYNFGNQKIKAKEIKESEESKRVNF